MSSQTLLQRMRKNVKVTMREFIETLQGTTDGNIILNNSFKILQEEIITKNIITKNFEEILGQIRYVKLRAINSIDDSEKNNLSDLTNYVSSKEYKNHFTYLLCSGNIILQELKGTQNNYGVPLIENQENCFKLIPGGFGGKEQRLFNGKLIITNNDIAGANHKSYSQRLFKWDGELCYLKSKEDKFLPTITNIKEIFPELDSPKGIENCFRSLRTFAENYENLIKKILN